MLLDSNDTDISANNDTFQDVIFDVSVDDFEEKVILNSMETPVVVDFWAPWCAPCKQLMPLLEEAVKAAAGKVKMAKVNIDDNPELAQALRVQSVPSVFAFFQGRPIDAFTGAKLPGEIKAFIQKMIETARQEQPESLDIPAALESAAKAQADNEVSTAQEIYAQILQVDPVNVQAYIGLARIFIESGELEQARHMIESAPETIAKNVAFEGVRAALDLAENPPENTDISDFITCLDQNPDNHEARFEMAMALFAGGREEDAIDALIEIISRNREWEEQKARIQLLKFFDALGPTHPQTLAGRRKFSSIWLS